MNNLMRKAIDEDQAREAAREMGREIARGKRSFLFCENCGKKVGKGGAKCVHCEEVFCNKCYISCKKCKKSFCKECSNFVEGCYPRKANLKYCDDCSEGLCYYCNKKTDISCKKCNAEICKNHTKKRIGFFGTKLFCKKLN